MNHKPVCVKCKVEFQPEKNGVGLVDYAQDRPYKIWDADKWRCPGCGYEIVVGFAERPIAIHHEEHFKQTIESYEKDDLIIECYEDTLWANTAQFLNYVDTERAKKAK